MSEYKRLTKQAGWHKDIDLKDELGYSYIYQRLSEWENDYESGKVVKLPCKLGDTVYKVEREYGYSNDTYFWNIVEKPFELGMLDYLWGKMIFLNREEAEKRLKEVENGRN